MFNNPLRKYASGGAAPSQEQQKMLEAFVAWLPKRIKEFANMVPEQIVEALNGMSQSPEGQKQVEQLMQQFQQEMSSTSQFAKGGKLHDFICKHANGGLIKDCGCKEDGGKVEMAENGSRLSRREALAQAQEIYGYDANQARTAYTNAKNALRKSGLRGSALRQAAREMIAKSQAQSNGPVEKIAASINNVGLSSVPQSLIGAPIVRNNYDNMSFSNAFRAAANIADNGGAKTFSWRGKEYGTNRSSKVKLPVITVDDIKEPEVDLSIEMPALNTDIIPAIKQIAINDSMVSHRPMHAIDTLVGTGYYPDVARTEEEINAILNNQLNTNERRINDEKMPSLKFGRWDYQPNTIFGKTIGNLVYSSKNDSKIEKGSKGIDELPTTDRYPGFGIVKDTVFVNPEGKQERVVILANDLGNAVKQSIVGKDTLSLEGDFLNGKFINLGDQQTNNKDVENKIQELRNKNNTTKKEVGGRFKNPLNTKKSKGAEK